MNLDEIKKTCDQGLWVKPVHASFRKRQYRESEKICLQVKIIASTLQKLKGYWKLRVGGYRVVFEFARSMIIVPGIGHRKAAMIE